MIRGRLCHSLRRWRRVMGACGGGQSRGIHELDELDEQPRQPRAERQEHEGARGFRTAALARCTASHRYPRWELFGVCPMVEKSPRRRCWGEAGRRSSLVCGMSGDGSVSSRPISPEAVARSRKCRGPRCCRAEFSS